MRTTLARAVSFEGTGIHTGAACRVTVSPSEREDGLLFASGRELFPITSARRADAERNTTIVFPDGREISTVEHLLSALAGMGIDDAIIECESPEFPILDGSALPFASEIAAAGTEERGADERVRPSLASPVGFSSGRAYIMALPSEELSFTYTVDYPGTAIGTEMKDFTLTRDSYLAEIAPARTFALESEVEAMRRAGLAKGGSLDNALIVGEDGPIGGAALRVASEYAAHKLLDLIGDLALLGEIPTARYICARGGHSLHYKLVSRLRRGC